MKKFLLLLIPFILLTSCASGTICVSISDKYIKGQRNKYVSDYSKCPNCSKQGFLGK